MRVILVKDIKGVGRSGDVKEVSDGYARNFLVPKGLAMPASTSLIEKAHKEGRERQEKLDRQQQQAQTLKAKLEGKIFTIKAKANKETLFAAIHEKEVAQAIGLQSEQIIITNPIKTTGAHEVEARLFDNIRAKIKLNIESI